MVKKQYQSSFALSIVSNLLLTGLLIATNRIIPADQRNGDHLLALSFHRLSANMTYMRNKPCAAKW
jgi:hypothetical protein